MIGYLAGKNTIVAPSRGGLQGRKVVADMRKSLLKNVLCAVLSLFLSVQLLTVAFAVKDDWAKEPAVDPVSQNDRYSAVMYDNTSGLPTSEANAIEETADGTLWIGSYSGLVSYDGTSFVRTDSTTGIASVVSLYADSRNRLWIGTNDKGLFLMERGALTGWNTMEGLPAEKISSITEDERGTIYIATTAGIVTIGEDMEIQPLDDSRINGAYIEEMCVDSSGLIYGITNGDDIFTLRDGRVEFYLPHDQGWERSVLCICPDSRKPGSIYMGTEDSVLYYCSPGENFADIQEIDISPLSDVMAMEQFGDKLWVCGRTGIGVLENGDFTMLGDLPMNNSVGDILTDYQGNLWFTSTRQGVMKVVPNQFSDVFEKNHLTETVVNSTCLDGDRLYIATDTGLIVTDGNGPVSSIPLDRAVTASGAELNEKDLIQMLDGCRIRSVIRDSQGRLWFSTWRACGLVRYNPARGEVTVFTEEDGLSSDHLRAVCERPDGSILVANTGGVCVIEGNRVTERYDKTNGIANPETLTVSYADNGDILLGSDGDGIYVISDRGTRCIGTESGLESPIVMRIKRDPKRDVFWIVTSNSIAYMTSDYQVTTIKEFPYSNNFDLFENSLGEMWVLSSNGIYVVPVQELMDNGEIQAVHYGIANGLPCIATGNSYSDLTESGELYMAGTTGVARVNIDYQLEDISQLKAAVTCLDADGVRIFPDADGKFSVPAKTRKLTVYSSVFNYSLMDPQVVYKMDGFDQEAETVWCSEMGPVDYTNLPGGTYRFVMHLKDGLGHGNKTISTTIVKAKKLHEQTWFFPLLGLAVAALVGTGVWHYLQRKTRILERKHQEEVRQERLATELQTATNIQQSMLPHDFPPFPDRKEFDIYATMTPAREVGGDFYDFFMVDEDHLCLVIADVSGKGIPAALFMMSSKIIIQSFARLGQSAAEILRRTNEAICSNNKMSMFVTVWLGILEISTGRITAANAGHEYPALMRGGEFSLFKDKHGFVVGGMEGLRYKEYEIQLKPGDKLFLYTDGVPEAADRDKNMFGTERMISALNARQSISPRETLEVMRAAVDGFVQESEQFDDLTMLCIEYKGPEAGADRSH